MSEIRVGILHSLTGTMASSETPLKDAALMAIAEINQAGGVLGKIVRPIVEDAASESQKFASKALKLIEVDRVVTLFGCWTSASRKSVIPILEAHNTLLWYPLQYEGLECSKQVFYTGLCPNQQVEPAVQWLLEHIGKRFYLIGSDYVFPRTVNKIIKAQLKQQGGALVGEAYKPLGNIEFASIISEIENVKPDLVFSTINGDSNRAFYAQYQQAGISASEIPIMAVSVAEVELQNLATSAFGHYASWSYFQSLDTEANQAFVKNFQARYGDRYPTSDPIEAAYTQVYLWKQAVEAAQSFESDRVRNAAYGQTFASPSGAIAMESNHHVRKSCRIGKIKADGQFQIVYTSDTPIQPLPWMGVEQFTQNARWKDSLGEDSKNKDLSNRGDWNPDAVIDLLAEVPQSIDYICQLEQTSNQLKKTLSQLQREIHERIQSQEALYKANQEISALNAMLKTENLRMNAELAVTRQLQKMILPTDEELKNIEGLDIAGFMEPASEVGGDYYDVLQLNGRVKIGIGDVTGHGLESNVLMIMVQTSVRTLLAMQENLDHVKFLVNLNRAIFDNVQRMKSDKNLTLSILDYEAGNLYLSGQHEEMIVVRQGGILERIDTVDLGFPIGLESNITDFVNQTHIRLNSGDVVVLYTDGITEAENIQNERYGIERLCEVVRLNYVLSSTEICQVIVDDIRSYIGKQKVYDDITLLVLKQK
ncbi:urea ABC transporter substrate-binding protein [Tumidithrix elongata RA019]|uniref:Urea ABC transporter substrate-binding protein n=1 Tax=Tumidithrix elongata BACA0141 TaxID=2716417 RepID=A0AAW9PVM9_9CYAN|nr:urea ABC transporter substrate-binding protein [Tumidithrix elongata RA019]